MVFDHGSPRAEALLLEDLAWLGRLARRLVGDPAAAEDVVQETWVAVLRRPRAAGRPSRSWLATVARNFVSKERRGRANRAHRESETARDEALPSPEELTLRVERQRLLTEAVVRLREPYRSTLILRYAEGLPPAEIARRQNVPGGTVRRRIKHALDELRRDLDRRFGGERHAWHAAFVPLLPTGSSATGVAQGTGTQAVLLGGILAMKKLVLAAVVVALAGGSLAVWSWRNTGVRPDSIEGPTVAVSLPQAPAESGPSADALGPETPRATEARIAAQPVDAVADELGSVVRGQVLVPDDCRNEEELAVFALARDASYEELVVALQAGEPETAGLVVDHCRAEADGSFEISFPPGLREGFLFACGLRLHSDRAQPVDLTAGEPFALLETRAGALIRGHVTVAEEGLPLDGVEVQLIPVGGDLSPAAGLDGSAGFAVRTGSGPNGSFEFRAVPVAHEYLLLARPGGLAAMELRLTELVACTETDVTLALGAGADARGRVLDAEGRPVEGAEVHGLLAGRWLGFDDTVVRSTESAEDGSFALHALPEEGLRLRAWKAGWLASDKLAVDPPHTEIELVLEHGNAIEGRLVTHDGTPVAGQAVEAVFDRAFRFGEAIANALRGDYGRAVTREDGTFSIRGVGPGPFTLQAHAPGADADASLHARLDGVRPGGKPVQLVLAPLQRITGKLVIEGTLPESFEVHASRLVEGPQVTFGFTRRVFRFERSDGSFVLDELALGTWELWATAAGFCSPEPQRVHLSGLAEAPGVVLALTAAVTVRGRVLTPGGQPQHGARVHVDAPGPSWLQPFVPGQPTRGAVTAEDGSFELAELAPGTLSLYAAHDEYADSAVFDLDLLAGEVATDFELVLRQGGSVAGTYYAEDGGPAVSRMVHVLNQTTEETLVTLSDPQGEFRFDHLPPGLWMLLGMRVDSVAAGADGADMARLMEGLRTKLVEVREGETLYVDLGAPSEDPLELHGRVTSGGEPYAHAWLVAFASGRSLGEMKVAVTDADGRYEIALDQPGSYGLSVQQYPGVAGSDQTINFAVEIPITERYRHDIEVPVGRIFGRVLGPDGKPVANERVSLISTGEDTPDFYHQGQLTEIRTDRDGRYEVPGLFPGEYYLAAGGAHHGRVGRGPLGLRRDEELEVDLELPRAGSIAVVVFDGYGQPLGGATVFARRIEGTPVDVISDVVSDADGLCVFGGLAPGDYTLLARSRGGASEDGPVVTVSAGEEASTELHVHHGARVWVELVSEDGLPVQGWFEILDDEGREVGGLYPAAELEAIFAEGGFSPSRQVFGPLPPGSYTARATAFGGGEARETFRVAGEDELVIQLRF